MWGTHSLQSFPRSNASLSREVSVFYPPFPAQRPGHLNANRTYPVPSTTSHKKPTRAFSDCRQDPSLGIRRHKDSCVSIYLFSTLHGHSPAVVRLMACNPRRASTSPVSSPSSCHRKIKHHQQKTNKTLSLVHLQAVPTNSCTDSDQGNVCGPPTLWQAFPPITSLSSPYDLWRREHRTHFKTCKRRPSKMQRNASYSNDWPLIRVWFDTRHIWPSLQLFPCVHSFNKYSSKTWSLLDMDTGMGTQQEKGNVPNLGSLYSRKKNQEI